MPLLKRKAFEKSSASGYLRDDDEVFHCEITDEIFKDYEEYCERIILVNSMVWTCEMTGKNNLTYAEALETEKAARNSLRDFPMELRIPILYLATKTTRTSFSEMSEDVFNYVRERYFVGETVEACLDGDNWQEAHILSVVSQKQHPDNKTMLPATSYCYEVEQYDDNNSADTGQIGTVPYERIRRRKGIFSREKNRLFLKQFVEMGSVITIKASAIEEYNINKVHFNQIFTGAPPIFPPSRKLLISPSSSKLQSTSKLKSLKTPHKGRQELMDKFIKKTAKSEDSRKSAQEMSQKMRRAEEQLRQQREEEKAQKKEKTAKGLAYLKEWQKVKDDLELEDHKILPKGTPLEIEGLEQKHIGDFFAVLDFVHTYSEVLKTKDVFHNELDWDTLRKALTMKESAGMFSDFIQMFLSAIFSLQEDETDEYNERGGIQESNVKASDETEMGINHAILLATRASKWAQTYLGTPLSKLPLDPSTVSEVLRLHLLSSGGVAGSRCVALRYHHRGGYSSTDDPGLHLRIHRPQLLMRLTQKHVADLPLDDKFTILHCLMNQVLSYATVRDIIEDKFEEHKNLKQTYKLLQINERKREPKLGTARMELRREAAAKKEQLKLSGAKARQVDEEMKKEIEKITKESDQKKVEFEKKSKELQMQLLDFTNYLGMDRAYHRYWLSRRVGGLFVEAGTEYRGTCRAKPVLPAHTPVDSSDLLAYVTKLYNTGAKEKEGSDKENESGSNSRGISPKKPLLHINGVNNKVLSPDRIEQMRDLMVCTADVNTCYVHGKSEGTRWWVLSNEEQLDALIASLNKRGLREGELRHVLETEHTPLVERLSKCPFGLNGTTRNQNGVPHLPATRRRTLTPSFVIPPESSLEEALDLDLRERILDLEAKIHHGCLGALKVKDREAWRGTIMLRSYDKQADFLSWGPNRAFRDDTHLPEGQIRIPNGTDEDEIKEIRENKYRDPVYYLEHPKPNGIKKEPGMENSPDVIRGLAGALLQVSQGIHHKYIKRPLGLDDKERKDREARNKPCDLDALERWEVSLMESRSIAALTLHLFVIDASVCWSASVMHASCKLCRRRTDPDNMLLCDGCNKGHHLYCLKPQLSKVPEGDWFCDQCKPKEKTPRKRRKLYTEENNIEQEEYGDAELSLGVCGSCGSGGELGATCYACSARFHMECTQPPLARAAKRWTCATCLTPPQSRAPAYRRRCATAAMSSIQQYARDYHKRHSTDSEDSEFNTALVKLKVKQSRGNKEHSPMLNGKKKRGRKSKEELNGSLSKKGRNSLTNGVDEGGNRKRKWRHEVKLHTQDLEHLLNDALKHKDSWPFYEPVSVDQVPDYLEIITTPMDLSRVKEKLQCGQYSRDEEVLSDIALVFFNCYTYNQDTHPVAKAGSRLEKYVIKRCKELNLPPLPENKIVDNDDDDDEDNVPLKRSLPESDESPQAKIARR